MKNKHCDSLKCILAKNVRSSGNSIIYCWISMLLTGICRTTVAAVVLRVDYGAEQAI